MASAVSGYVGFSRNYSSLRRERATRTVPVPINSTVVVSFKENTYSLTYVHLLRHYIHYYHDGLDKRSYLKRDFIWSRHEDIQSDFAHMFQAVQFSVIADTIPGQEPECPNAAWFKLFFSFFPDDKKPLKSVQGFWNCSVKHYSSFHQHLACNLKTECEDGRDETGDCPYSSPQCQGLFALCNRCYLLVDSLREAAGSEVDFDKKAEEHCSSIESRQSVPTCDYGWYATFRNKTKLHPDRLDSLRVGLHSKDSSLPRMYRHVLVSSDRTILYHHWHYSQIRNTTLKTCFVTAVVDKLWLLIHLSPEKCGRVLLYSYSSDYGTLCERTFNKSETGRNNPQKMSVSNTTFSASSLKHGMIRCPDGHVTHTFFLCGSDHYKVCGQHTILPCKFSGEFSHTEVSELSHHRGSSVAVFTCNDNSIRMSYTLVCDFITDCSDESDESICKHPPCARMFRCSNGECLPFERWCDDMFHCQDGSDEGHCPAIRANTNQRSIAFPSPVLIRFNGIAHFSSSQMESNESCPDTHYRCPGDNDDCLPVYTRCNGLYDCIDHQDEEGCGGMKCPGLFRCRLSTMCLQNDHVCDGWPHCPMSDDELSCGMTCPTDCLCHGHTFQCPQPFSAALFPQLRYLDATGSGLALRDVGDNSLLIGLVLAQCSLTLLPQIRLVNVRFLDLSGNELQFVNLSSVLGLENLHTLSLSNNPLSSLSSDLPPVDQHNALKVLHLAHITLTVLDTTVLSLFPRLEALNLTHSSIHTIGPAGFQFTSQLRELYIDNSPVQTFPPDVFQELSSIRFISTQNYKLCCPEILPQTVEGLVCLAPRDEISSCNDLLLSWTYRACLWMIACLSLTGNVLCCCARLLVKGMASASGYSVFVTNLTMADFLMGVYGAVIGVADERFRGQYLHNDNTWKNSAACKVAGFLSLLSSEVSVLIVWFITLDRFVVLRFTFSSVRFGRTSAAVACLMTWLLGLFLALIPLLPVTSHWEFFSQTGICIPLPVTRGDFKGRFYSIGVLIIFNFFLFLLISTGQAFIYWSVQGNTLKINSTKVSRDMTIARRLITIAVTDFLCWFPVGLCGMLALGSIPIPGEVNVALAVFILPLNSAINPFMYTFNMLAERKRKTEEDKLVKWLESHPGLISD